MRKSSTKQGGLLFDYVTHISNKLRGSLSYTGDQPDLVTADESSFFDEWKRTTPEFEKLSGFFRSHDSFEKIWQGSGGFVAEQDFAQLSTDVAKNLLEERERLWSEMTRHAPGSFARKDRQQKLQQFENMNSGVFEVLARGRAQYYKIQATVGRRWAPDFLRSEACTGEKFSQYYQKLEQIAEMRTPAAFLSQLQLLKTEHDSAALNPRVVIEGAGPVGLLTAIKQYRAGADITLLEKRDTLYNRSQIVRLDRQWMNDLKFYLGTQYDELFHKEDGTGHIRPDGSGHIVISALEEALHSRLTELMTVANPSDADYESLKRLAAHRVVDVRAPGQDQKHKAYTVVAQYDGRYDHGKTSEADVHPDLVIPVDMLVCAGGKNSSTRNQFFVPQVKTEEKYYGVASWQGRQIEGSQQDAFPFRQDVITLDQTFQDAYIARLDEILNPLKGSVGSVVSDGCRHGLLQFLGKPLDELRRYYDDTTGDAHIMFESAIEKRVRPEGYLDIALAKCSDLVIQLRLFANRNMTYVGMEIPRSIQGAVTGLEDNLAREGATSEEIKQVSAMVIQAWFQTLAEHKGIAQKHNLDMPMMDGRVASFFPVALDRVNEGLVALSDHETGAGLDVVAVGDAAVSSHFMSASGLGGGRISSGAVESYTMRLVDDVNRDKAAKKLNKEINRAGNFILSRGAGMLSGLRLDDQKKRSVAHTTRELDALVESSQKPEWDKAYRVTKTKEGDYKVFHGKKEHTLRITFDGFLKHRRVNSFSTFKLFELEILKSPEE